MKNFLIVTSLLLSGNAMARGVVVKCWNVGSEQTEENLVYQNDGEYIHNSVFKIDGKDVAFDSNESCISWNFPSRCEEVIETDAKTYDLFLVSIGEATEENKYLEPMLGYVRASGERAVALSCTREAL